MQYSTNASRGAHRFIQLMSLDSRVVPDVFPELGGFRDTPMPQILVAVKRDTMLLTCFGHEVIHHSGLWGRVPPELLGAVERHGSRYILRMFKARVADFYKTMDTSIPAVGNRLARAKKGLRCSQTSNNNPGPMSRSTTRYPCFSPVGNRNGMKRGWREPWSSSEEVAVVGGKVVFDTV